MRRERALDCIDERNQRGLEIGPLATPIASKANGDVRYVDHADTEGLRRKYAEDAHMRSRLDQIVEVDYVLAEGESLAEGLASRGPFDYIIASHVIEHIPDVVTWLDEIHGLLVSGGILSLVVPDKRFTFDVNRAPTDVSAVLDAHQRRLTRPTFAQIYDFSSRTFDGVDPRKVWAGEQDYHGVVRTDCPDPSLMAFEFADKVLASDQFIDIHCHVFTPASLLQIIDQLGHLGLLRYEIAAFHPTARDDLEFFISLRALEATAPDIGERQRRAAASARTTLEGAVRPAAEQAALDRPGQVQDVQLSAFERRLIAMKRDFMSRVRRTASRNHRG